MIRNFPMKIPAGSSQSAGVKLWGINASLQGIFVPTGWTGSDYISFLVAQDDVTGPYMPLHQGDTVAGLLTTAEAIISVTPNSYIQLDVHKWGGILPWLKVRAGTSDSPITVASDQTITVYSDTKKS